MNCGKCHKDIPDDSVYCCYCGNKQIREKTTAKRANGLGSVYYDEKRKAWIAQIVTGRHYTSDLKLRFSYRRISYKTRTEALKAVTDIDAEKNEHPALTLSYYFATYESGKMAALSHDKQKAHRIAYNRLKSLWGTPVKDLTITDLQRLINASCDSYYPAKDIRVLLNTIYKLAAADDREINPVLPSLIQLPKLEEEQIEPFTEEEQIMLWLSYESGNMDAAIPLIMIYTGMMTGEMRSLNKNMIHLEDHEITGAGLKTDERKKKSVLLPDDIVPVLEDVIAKAETDVLYPISRERFYRRYYKALKTAGITRKLSPYACRHTTATVLAVHENIAPQTLQRVMRWKSTKMMDRYVTPSDQDARTAVNRI